MPFFGMTMKLCKCLFLDRDSASDKAKVQEEIIARQRLAGQPGYEPLIIFPEGGTSNGEFIIKFKRGCFAGLLPIWPKIHKYHSWFQSPCTGVADGLGHYLIAASIPFATAEKMELPIFRPNDYFF